MEKFTINKAFAESYDKSREKQECQRLKDKYGDNSESSSSESEVSDAEDPAAEAEFLRTLAAIKSKDPKIYDISTTFFHQVDGNINGQTEASSAAKKKKEKNKKKKDTPIYLKDLERQEILDQMSDSDSEKKISRSDCEDEEWIDDKPSVGSYYAIQEAAKQSFMAMVDQEGEGGEDFLVVRKKTAEEKEEIQNEYSEWLKGQSSGLTDRQLEKDLKPLRDNWADPNADPNEKELLNFFINKEYEVDDDGRPPTYAEIIAEEEELKEDEEELERASLFETKYNFRFEEPTAAIIPSFPRSIPSSMRNKDSRRIEKRKLDKEREVKKKEKKREELKRLKILRKKEILDKIARLSKITGNKTIGFGENDLEADLDEDFDPKVHDKLMKRVLGSDYYDQDDDNVKPVFDDYELQGDEYNNWDEWDGRADEGEDVESETYDDLHCEHPDFIMDADHVPKDKNKKKKEKKKDEKKKKIMSKFEETLETKKPVFDPAKKTYDEYLKEYYNIDYDLDYEDLIGDQPVRFKYRSVVPNDYGLTTDEILSVPDKELNLWVSVKKMSQYRTKEEEEIDVHIFHRKAKNKLKILTSLNVREEDKPESSENKKSKKRKKKSKSSATSSATATSANELNNTSNNTCTIDEEEGHGLTRETEDVVVTAKPAKRHSETNVVTGPPVKRRRVDEVSGSEDIEVLSSETSSEVKRKEKKKKQNEVSELDTNTEKEVEINKIEVHKKKSEKKKKKNHLTMSADRLKAYEIPKKIYKYKYSCGKNV